MHLRKNKGKGESVIHFWEPVTHLQFTSRSEIKPVKLTPKPVWMCVSKGNIPSVASAWVLAAPWSDCIHIKSCKVPGFSLDSKGKRPVLEASTTPHMLFHMVRESKILK